MAEKNLYNKNSIQSLDPLSFTRLRPQVYAGDCAYSTQTVIEIFSNAVDEARLGHGNLIRIKVDKDEITISDCGQGFLPNVVREEDGKTILEAAFSVLNTSAKFKEDGTYEGSSLGMLGIGSKIATFLSHHLEVKTWRDGAFEKVYFIEGKFHKRETGVAARNTSGTEVNWQPSEEFFTNAAPDEKVLRDLFQTVACLCPGLTIAFDWNGKTTEYLSKKGLNDLVDSRTKGKEIIKNRLCIQQNLDKQRIDLVMTYVNNYSSTLIPYVNAGLTEIGPHITQFKAAITRTFNKFLREKNILKEKDENLSGESITEGMFLIFNLTATGVAYNAQVKSTITKIDMKPFLNVFIPAYESWLENNEKDARALAEKALLARKAEAAAKKAKEAVRGVNEKKQKALKFDSKLADCYGKDRTKCELIICEGDSASGNLKLARDNSFQAVLPVRGKILNCCKASLAQIQKNQEIMTMIDAFGLTVDPKTMKLTYNKKDLRYGKIIIMSDADVDGSHIKNLFYTFIWTFCPQLIKDGYIYAGVPPLYKITIGKEYKYLKDDVALEEFKKINQGKKYIVNRLKG